MLYVQLVFMAKVNKYQEPFDMGSIPNEVLFAESRKRYKEIRQVLGRYGVLKKISKCKGCGRKMGVREKRKHKCKISWPKR